MLDEVRLEKTFVKRMDSLSNLFQISNEEAIEIRDTIIDTIELLANGEELPDVYSDHELSQHNGELILPHFHSIESQDGLG